MEEVNGSFWGEIIMTIFGGTDTGYGTVRDDGFLVVCCKCGWHSMVELGHEDSLTYLICNHCGNKYELRG